MTYPDWYIKNIEKPIRGVVYLLRNNGYNTEFSCGHEMWVQGRQNLSSELVSNLHGLLLNNGYYNYKLIMEEEVTNGHFAYFFKIKIGKTKRK